MIAKKEWGASLVEYALLVALIALVSLVAVQALGNRSSQRFSTTADAVFSRGVTGATPIGTLP